MDAKKQPFTAARKSLHSLLQGFTFTIVLNPTVVPEGCVQGGRVTHYFTTAQEVSYSKKLERGRMVWVKKKGRVSGCRWEGCVGVSDDGSKMPKPGDILVGQLVSSTQVENSRNQKLRQQFLNWIW